jgi:hypothetical protein
LPDFQSAVFASRRIDQDVPLCRSQMVRAVALQRIELIAAILNTNSDNEEILNFTAPKRNVSEIEEGRIGILEIVDAAFDLGTYTRLEPEIFPVNSTGKD